MFVSHLDLVKGEDTGIGRRFKYAKSHEATRKRNCLYVVT